MIRIKSLTSVIIILTAFATLISGCAVKPGNPSELAKKSREILFDQIKNGAKGTREAIVHLTGGMVDEEAIPLLEIALKDKDQDVVKKAVERLVEIKNPLALTVKRQELGDRFNADLIETLIELGAKDLDSNIETGLATANTANRARAVELLAKYKKEDVRERIRTFLNDPEPIVALKAKIALAGMGDTEVLKGLEQYLDSNNQILQLASINLIGDKDLKEYRDKLLGIAKDNEGILAQEALRTLYKWDDKEARAMVMNEMSSSIEIINYPLLKDVEEKKDAEMLPTLRKAMSSSRPNERYSAARVAVTIDPTGTPDVLEFIFKGLESPDPGVREQVAVALSQLRDMPEVKRQLEQKGLKDKNQKVVNASIIALGKVGDSESLAYLAPFLDDADLETRSTASAAILNIINRKNLPGKTEEKSSTEKTEKSEGK